MANVSEKELQALLKGEHMAIDGYEKYIQSIQDQSVKIELQKIQQDHKMHAISLAERIQNLGGKPADGVGIVGRVAGVVSSIKDIGRTNTVGVLKQAYKGEDTGIKMADEIVKGDLDNDSRNLVNNMLNDDRNHLGQLDTLIKSQNGIQ